MKRYTFILFLLIATSVLYAQSCRIVATSYKQITRTNGVWSDWPSYWTSYSSESRSNPTIVITTISEGSDGDIYNFKVILNDGFETNFNVIYDATKSTEIRKKWNDKYINCYREMNGSDYVFTEKVSLQSLVKDNGAWASNTDSKIYLMAYSQNISIAFK